MDCLTTGKAKLKAKKNKTPNPLLLVTPSKILFRFILLWWLVCFMIISFLASQTSRVYILANIVLGNVSGIILAAYWKL